MPAVQQTQKTLSKPKDRWVKSSMKVLIITDNPSASQPVLTNLRELGMDVQFAHFDGHKLASVPNEAPDAILCYLTDFIEKSETVCTSLREHYLPKTLPIIGALLRPTRSSMDHFDSVLFAPVHSSQIANRVDSMIRLSKMETEITLRMETLKESFNQNIEIIPQDLNRSFRILFVGKAAPEFMVVINALEKRNVETVAAFTSFSAFDYLHDRQFDAVVLNALDYPEPALSISEAMRRNAKLYHVPTLFLVDPETFEHSDAAYERGARDLVPMNASLKEISGRILELANYHRIHDQLKQRFDELGGEECIDSASGTFNEAFLRSHLKRLSEYSHRQGQSLTLLGIRPYAVNSKSLSQASIKAELAKIGTMLKSFIRMHDVIARLDDGTYMLAFPGENEERVETILQRIRSLFGSIRFETQDKQGGSMMDYVSAIVQHTMFETSDALIDRTIDELNAQLNPAKI